MGFRALRQPTLPLAESGAISADDIPPPIDVAFRPLSDIRGTSEASAKVDRRGLDSLHATTAPLSVHFANVAPPPLDPFGQPIHDEFSLAAMDVVVLGERAEFARAPATPPLVEFDRIPTDVPLLVALAPRQRSARRTYLDCVRVPPTDNTHPRHCELDATTAWIDLVVNAASPPAIVAVYRPADPAWRLERGAASRSLETDVLRIRIGPIGKGAFVLEPYDLAGPTEDLAVTITKSERIELSLDFNLR